MKNSQAAAAGQPRRSQIGNFSSPQFRHRKTGRHRAPLRDGDASGFTRRRVEG
jgi:hypothetical protein